MRSRPEFAPSQLVTRSSLSTSLPRQKPAAWCRPGPSWTCSWIRLWTVRSSRMRQEEQRDAAVFQRVVSNSAAPFHYLQVALVLEEETTRLSAVDLKHFITTGLKALYGEVGAALTFDLLKYDEDSLTALLRVSSRGLVKLWSSLTLLGSYQNQACAFRVLQVSPFLLALTGNSRELQLD